MEGVFGILGLSLGDAYVCNSHYKVQLDIQLASTREVYVYIWTCALCVYVAFRVVDKSA